MTGAAGEATVTERCTSVCMVSGGAIDTLGTFYLVPVLAGTGALGAVPGLGLAGTLAGAGSAAAAATVTGGPPVLVASYSAQVLGVNNANVPITTGAFSPQAGEILVVYAFAGFHGGFTGQATCTDSLGALTFTLQKFSNIEDSQYLFTAPVVSSPGSLTVSINPYSTYPIAGTLVVERWSGAALAASPAIAAAGTGASTGTFSTTISTAANGSVVSWMGIVSANSDPGSSWVPSYTGTATPTAITTTSDRDVPDGFIAGCGFAYQAAATAGSQTFGLTSIPAGWRPYAQLLGIEIEAA